jgi:hypothetical protein
LAHFGMWHSVGAKVNTPWNRRSNEDPKDGVGNKEFINGKHS